MVTSRNDRELRLIIAGSRYITEYRLLERAMVRSGFRPTVVLSGTCRGVDLLGERWAKAHGVPVERYPADWRLKPKYAGNLRNTTMVLEADALVCLWEGWAVRDDGGAADVILKAMTHGLLVREYTATELRVPTAVEITLGLGGSPPAKHWSPTVRKPSKRPG